MIRCKTVNLCPGQIQVLIPSVMLKAVCCPVARAVVDGDEENAVVLDANFDLTWGDFCCLTDIAEGLPYGEHRLRITIVQKPEQPANDFYLISILRRRFADCAPELHGNTGGFHDSFEAAAFLHRRPAVFKHVGHTVLRPVIRCKTVNLCPGQIQVLIRFVLRLCRSRNSRQTTFI